MSRRNVLTVVLLLAGFASGIVPAGAAPLGKGVTSEDREKPAPGPVLRSTLPEDEAGNDGCPGQPIACDDLVVGARIDEAGDIDHYAVQVEAGACLTIGTQPDSGQQQTDTVLELLNGDCSAILAMNDDDGPGSFSLISEVRVDTAGTYVIRVRHYLGGGTGSYRMFVKCTPGGEPNTVCATAIALDCGTIDRLGTTDCTGGDYSPQGPTGSCTGFSARGQDVVFRVDAVQGNVLTLTYQSTADGSLYLLTNCATPADSCVAGADANRAGEPETLTYTFPRDGAWYVVLDSFGTGTSGTWSLKGEFDCMTPVAPVTWGDIKSRHATRRTPR